MIDWDAEMDIFYLAFGMLRSVIKEVEPNMKYWVHPGINNKCYFFRPIQHFNPSTVCQKSQCPSGFCLLVSAT